MQIPVREWDNSDSSKRAAAALGSNEIQVWSSIIQHNRNDVQLNLSDDELERARRFQVERAREEFVSGRVVLRQVLGACLNRPAASLRFCYSDRGKPFLNNPRPVDVSFNVSHSGGRVVVALARGLELGIDIEHLNGHNDWAIIAERIFSSRELREMEQLPVEQQQEAFFNGWTRKEAYLKATGQGITEDLQAIEVTMSPQHEPRLLRLPGGADAVNEWSLAIVPLPTNFFGAIAFRRLPEVFAPTLPIAPPSSADEILSDSRRSQ